MFDKFTNWYRGQLQELRQIHEQERQGLTTATAMCAKCAHGKAKEKAAVTTLNLTVQFKDFYTQAELELLARRLVEIIPGKWEFEVHTAHLLVAGKQFDVLSK